jgi:hypothetical protein
MDGDHTALYARDHWLALNTASLVPGMSLPDLRRCSWQCAGAGIAFDDSWSLVTWAGWLRHRDDGKRTILLHIDDHSDLGCPRALRTPVGWLDPITGRPFVVSDESGVAAAVSSGAVGIGNFVTVLLLSVPSLEIRHLTSDRDLSGSYRLCPELLDAEASRGRRRAAVSAARGASASDPFRYIVTADPCELCDVSTDPEILLHVDFDYFLNLERWPSAMVDKPQQAQVERRVSALCDAIDQSDLWRHVVSTTIAFSPGFSPSRAWPLIMSRMMASCDVLDRFGIEIRTGHSDQISIRYKVTRA